MTRPRQPHEVSPGRSETGATAVEYAIMVVAIAALIVAIVVVLGRQTRSNFCESGRAFGETGQMDPQNVSAECS